MEHTSDAEEATPGPISDEGLGVLARWVPILSSPGLDFGRWVISEPDEDGVMQLPCFDYSPDALRFMAEVSGAGAGLPRGILSGMPLFLDRHHLSGATHRRCCRTYPGRGRLLMKGFGEPVGVFDVGWRERTA